MKTLLELFCGTKSISKAFTALGVRAITIDNDNQHTPDYCIDLLNAKLPDLPPIDFLWASPPCTSFSTASMARHWNYDWSPKTQSAIDGLRLIKNTLAIIEIIKPKIWFIENPRGMLRTFPFMARYKRNTVTYCQYGDTRMKPTDIWTNSNIMFRPMCKNGDKCHVRSPRGSKTGTQGLKNAIDRAVIVSELCDTIADYCINFN